VVIQSKRDKFVSTISAVCDDDILEKARTFATCNLLTGHTCLTILRIPLIWMLHGF